MFSMARMHSSDRMISFGLVSPLCTRSVRPPCVTTPTLFAKHQRKTCETSSVFAGRTSAAALGLSGRR